MCAQQDIPFDAVARLYREHGVRLVAALERYTDAATAEDAAHEVFVRLLQSDAEGREVTLGYLIVSGRNVIRSMHRNAAARQRATEHVKEAAPRERRAQPQADDLRSRLAAMVAQLPRDQKEVVVLTDVKGMTGKQASEALGVKMPTVFGRRGRALDRLRSLAETEAMVENAPKPGRSAERTDPPSKPTRFGRS